MKTFVVKPPAIPACAARRIGAMMASLALLLGFTVGIATPAHAWTAGNVWVNFGTWNCKDGGSVTKIQWAVDTFSAGPAGGDIGDNVIYPRVRVGAGAYNTLSYKLWCTKWGWYTYSAYDGWRSLTPYQSGLSYWY